ncbi:PPE domain-containing protein [Mycobacterium tuberculosis]
MFNLNQEGKARCFRIYRETLSRFSCAASAASSFGSVTSSWPARWRGPASAAMANAAGPYASWLTAAGPRPSWQRGRLGRRRVHLRRRWPAWCIRRWCRPIVFGRGCWRCRMCSGKTRRPWRPWNPPTSRCGHKTWR